MSGSCGSGGTCGRHPRVFSDVPFCRGRPGNVKPRVDAGVCLFSSRYEPIISGRVHQEEKPHGKTRLQSEHKESFFAPASEIFLINGLIDGNVKTHESRCSDKH
jgi:hypothetical protein